MSTQLRVADSVRMGASLAADLIESLASSSIARDLSRRMPARCSCEIPPPCWMPKGLGRVRSRVCPGGTAVLRLRVINCGASQRGFQIDATGADAGDAKLEPVKLVLGPMEAATVTATIPLPTASSSSDEREALVWVHGCHSHFLRWTVGAGGSSDSCHELDVEDCPDYIHHWYDHFYCDHPCPAPQKR
jgi:hypothetical protein